MEWYTIETEGSLDTPSLVLYPERIKNNISVLKSFVSDVNRLRPHVKTNKCAEVIRMMLESGISKFKCATIAEAETLAGEGAKDVLFAFQPVGPKGKRFCELQRAFPETTFSCLIDNGQTLSELSNWAKAFDTRVRVLIDLNVGMNRTGIAPGQEAERLYTEAFHTGGIETVGLHGYDGHIRDADFALRKQKCDNAFQAVEHMRQQVVKATGKAPVVVAGGTPTFPIHAERSDVECSPGTFIFWDKNYQQTLSEQPFEFAALVVTRIISAPDDQTLCVDLGHKSIASENRIDQRVYFLNAPDLDQPIGHSEEHMVFRVNKDHRYQVGDVLYGVPYHICPTVALYEEARTCRQNTLGEAWAIAARARKITI
jgi:D-serine deaminase-like pyridoxal phosphate-dependent protein